MTLDPVVLAAFLGAGALHILLVRFASRLRLVKPNFKGLPVFSSYGIAACGYGLAGILALVRSGLASPRNGALYAGVMGSMCLLGAVDDIFGSREVGGFKGHFRKLLFERRLTTGALKAIGGIAVGVVAGWELGGSSTLRWAIASLLIPAAANTVNILDLRPGRAVAVFFAGLVVTWALVLGELREPWLVGCIALACAVFAPADSRAKAMMGDSGANAFGAALGVTIAMNAGPVVQIAALVAFASVQLYSEKCSVSALIERNGFLRAIDRRLGVR